MAKEALTEEIQPGTLRDWAVADFTVRDADWPEGFAETWDYVEAPSCPQCGDSCRWNGDNVWVCGSDPQDCDNAGAEVDPLEAGAEGPMMSYYYPLPETNMGAYEMADAIRDLPLCVVVWEDDRRGTYALALTGGGMDLSWEICEAFIRLGLLPPAHFADLPGMADRGRPGSSGFARDAVIVAACVRSLEVAAEAYERRAIGARSSAERLRVRYPRGIFPTYATLREATCAADEEEDVAGYRYEVVPAVPDGFTLRYDAGDGDDDA